MAAIVYDKFSTQTAAGAPVTFAGSPALSVYKDANTTQTTTGVTLSVDFDGVTGLHCWYVDTADAFYTAGSDYHVVVTSGTVSSVSMVGRVVGGFSIENRSGLLATVPGRTLDVSASGEAGIDWANVGSPTTVVGLSGTTVKTATDVETDTADIQTRIPAALTGDGNIKADTLRVGGTLQTAGDVGSVTAAIKVTTDKITFTTANQVDARVLTNSVLTGYALSAAGVDAIWDEAAVGHTTADTFGDKLRAHQLAVLKLVVDAGSSTTAVVFKTVEGAAASATNDFYNGRVIIFTSGAMAGVAAVITDYVGATKVATVDTMVGTPADNVTAVIV